MGESIWKKEIHLRKPKAAVEAPAPTSAPPETSTSVWKKEARLRKRKAAVAPPPAPSPSEPATSVWKKEIHVGRRRNRGTVVVPVVPDAVERIVPPVAPPPTAPVTWNPPKRAELWSRADTEPERKPLLDPVARVVNFPSARPLGAEPISLLPRATEAGPLPAPVPERESEQEAERVAPAAWHLPAIPVVEPEQTPAAEAEPLAPVAWQLPATPVVEFEAEPEPLPVPVEAAATVEPEPTTESEPKPRGLKRELHLPRPPRRRPASESRHKATRVVGLRVGSSQLAAAQIENNGSAQLVQLARAPLAHGLVVGGEVREPAALAKALKAFFAANKLPKKDIRLGIASNRIGVRVLSVPAVEDPKQFENAIRFRAQEVLPIPVTEAVLDHVVLDEDTNDQGEAIRRVLLVFAHRDLIARYVDVCRSAGLRLVGIDLDAFALLRAVAQPDLSGIAPTQATVAVAVGHERTVFAVSDGRVCDFTRVLEWGGSAIDVAIARGLNLAPSEAAAIKHTLSLDQTDPPDRLSPLQLEAARAAVKAEIAVLGRELMSSLRFYQSRPESLDIGEILLSGGGAQLSGFAAELATTLGVSVRSADPFARVTLGKKLVVPDDSGSLAIAVGLGIEA